MTTRRTLLQALLAAGSAPLFIRHAFAAGEPERFALGIASGSPRHDRLVLWTRLVGAELPAAVSVKWELAEDEAFTRIAARGVEDAVLADGHSVHAEPAGLKPERWYWYRFEALGQRSAVGRTRTAPAPDAAVDKFSFAIASCQNWEAGRYAAWADVTRRAPDLVMFLGDYIYEYGKSKNDKLPRRHEGGHCRTVDDYRRRYAQYKSDPQLQAAHACAPWVVIWDDHEVDNDWAGNLSQRFEPMFEWRRAAAAQAWWEHMPVPKTMRPAGPFIRMSQQYDWGRLARILTVDDRSWRDPQGCPRPGQAGSNHLPAKDCPTFDEPWRTLLGREQERWLAQAWDPSRPWNLLAQQTLMSRFNWARRPDEPLNLWTDGWDGYPHARRRLLQDLQARRVENTVVLGGDIHMHMVSDIKLDFDDEKSPVIASEFCGSSISSGGWGQARISESAALNPHLHHARSDQRGHIAFQLRAGKLEAEVCGVREVWNPDSAVEVQARFAVEAGKPGINKA